MKTPEVTESKKLKYSYPLGIGAFLMSGCYRFVNEIQNSNEQREKRKKRSSNENDQFLQKYCRRYVVQENWTPCEVCQF